MLISGTDLGEFLPGISQFFGNRNSFLLALEMGLSNSRTSYVHSPITLTHAEIQNVGTMLPEGRYYEYHFLFLRHRL